MADTSVRAGVRGRLRPRVPAPLRHGVTIFLVLLVVEYLVIPKFAVANQTLHRLRHLGVVWIVLAVVLEGLSLFAYALLTRTLLPPNGPGLSTVFRIDLASTAVAHVIPGGTAGSASLGYRLFTSRGVLGRDAAFTMGTQGLGSAVVLNLMLWIALVISIPLAGAHVIYVVVALVGVLALLGVSALVYGFTRGEESAARFVRALGRRVPHLDERRLEASVRHIGDRLRDLWRDREVLRRAIGWATANWLLDAACLWAFLAALSRYVDPVVLFAAYGIANVAAVLPITPGGLGIVESTLIGLLSSSGVPPSIATLGVIGWRLVNFWLPIPVGAASYLSLRATKGGGISARRRALAAMALEARAGAPTTEGLPAVGERPAPPPSFPSTLASPSFRDGPAASAPAGGDRKAGEMTTLSVALGNYPHTKALKEREVSPEGFDLDFVTLEGPIIGAFRRMVRQLEFDVSEMAITTYLSAKENGIAFTAIPAFPVREFPHRAIVVNTDAGISSGKDLEGKRVGVRAYTVTTGVWARAVLADQYGVDLDKVTWVIADEEHVQAAVLPGNVESIPGADLGAMVSSGELAAGIGVTRPDTPNVAPFVTDRQAKEAEWAHRGIYPINHTVVIADSVIAEHPEAPAALYAAFVAAKQPFLDRIASGADLSEEDQALANRRELVGPDPVPYGIEANRSTLEAIVGFATAQHILTKPFELEELFLGE